MRAVAGDGGVCGGGRLGGVLPGGLNACEAGELGCVDGVVSLEGGCVLGQCSANQTRQAVLSAD